MESPSLTRAERAHHATDRGWKPALPALLDVEEIDRQGGRPWRRSPREWDALEPRSLYARRLRQPLLYGVALALAAPALVLALPIAAANACLHGPRRVLFLQRRVGRRGRLYVIYKFRTMRDESGAPDQARVTSFGRFLRNSHLDELPQLLNVLRGEMCLIGPRPEMVSIERWAARRLPAFSERLALRPGITGLAQITQGYAADGDLDGYRRKLALNRLYRRRISARGDLGILLRTVGWMLARRGWRWAGARSVRPVRRRAA